MSNEEAYRLVSKVEARSWTQPARNMFNDEAYRLKSKRKETRCRKWTQKGPSRKMSDKEVHCLEEEEKETRNWTQKERKVSNDGIYCLEREEKEELDTERAGQEHVQ